MKNVNRVIILLITAFIGFSSTVYSQKKVESEDALNKDSVYVVVEQMPVFPGGDMEMHKFISENLKYPVVPEEEAIIGSASVRFVVSKTGEVKDVKGLRHADSALAKELARVIKLMPRWIPGKQNGENVDVYFTLPIHINLKK
ncbi:energy transducer TonB [Dysgonomonas sp. ZJ709]|uniref:energy transducer TonB n=1 Tax=Dysgonomonas sp. ZJ709 TaxID=2709797 RepID=UPI0013EB2E4D|nr:energy transducer TonB [Dysgonomonas sp. ZJ709]